MEAIMAILCAICLFGIGMGIHAYFTTRDHSR